MLHFILRCFTGIGLILLIASRVAGQTVTANFQELPLQEVFRQMEQKAGLKISFDPALINGVTISTSFTNKKPQDAFQLILQNTNLEAEFLNGGYVVITTRNIPPPLPEWTLCGFVKDFETGEALPYVTVLVSSSRKSVLTDESGKFSINIRAVSIKHDSAILHYLGYFPESVPLTALVKGKCPEIKLRVSTRELLEILITDHAVDPVGLPVGYASSTGKRPEKGGFVPGLGEPDPMRMLQMLPGVSAEGDKAGELIVRGGGSDQNLVLWQGIPIYHTGHLFGVVSALNPYMVKQVNIWKGNFSADMGGRASSVIEMQNNLPVPEKIKVGVGINLLSFYGSLELPFKNRKGAVVLAGRIANSDLIKNDFYRRLFGYATQNSRIKNDMDIQSRDSSLLHSIKIQPTSGFSDFNAQIFWQPRPKSRWEINSYVGSDLLNYRVDANVPETNFYYAGGDSVYVINAGISTKFTHNWTEAYKTEWSWASSTYVSDYKFSASFDSLVFPQHQQRQNNSIIESIFKFDNTWQLNKSQSLRFGFQSVKTVNEFSEKTVNTQNPDAGTFWESDVPSNQSAFYGIWQISNSNIWHFETGMRRVIFNYSDKTYWEPRINAWWSPVQPLRFKCSAGVFHQFMRQAFIWNDLGLNNEAWFTADDNTELPVLTNRQLSLGAGWMKNGWTADIELYSKWLDPVTGVNLRFNGQPQNVWNIKGNESVSGIEFLLRKKWGVYTQLLSYTYSRSFIRYDSLNSGYTFAGDYDQPHTLTWSHHLGWKHWVVSGIWNYRSGRPYTPPKNISITQNPDGSTSGSIIYNRWNSGRLPDYKRLDISVQYLWKRRAEYAFGLSVFNFLDNYNVQNREFFVEPKTGSSGQQTYGISSIERTLLGRAVNLFFLFRW